GRTAAPESKGIAAVEKSILERALKALSEPTRTMLRVQYLAGMRPSEVIAMQPELIDTSGHDPEGVCYPGLWTYLAPSKTAHLGIVRLIFLGPQAQAVLPPWLQPGTPGTSLFDPQTAPRRHHGAQPACYNSTSYLTALTRACQRAGVDPFPPYAVRHTRA